MNIEKFIHDRHILIESGPTGTRLLPLAHEHRVPPTALNSAMVFEKGPHAVQSILEEYAAVGADVILANTFSTTPRSYVLNPEFTPQNILRFVEDGVAIARRVADKFTIASHPRFVAASIGPTGLVVTPKGKLLDEGINFRTIVNAYADAVRAAEHSGADVLQVETFDSTTEAQLALDAIAATTDLPFILTASYLRTNADGIWVTSHGYTPDDMTQLAAQYGPLGIGFNCGGDGYMGDSFPTLLHQTTEAHHQFAPEGTLFVAKPNAGPPHIDTDMATTYPDATVANVLIFASQTVGAAQKHGSPPLMVGTCCGGTTEQVAALRQKFNEYGH